MRSIENVTAISKALACMLGNQEYGIGILTMQEMRRADQAGAGDAIGLGRRLPDRAGRGG